MYLPYDKKSLQLDSGSRPWRCHGYILECKIDPDNESKYYHLDNKPLPPRLQGSSRALDFWVTFSDGTYVLGDKDIEGGVGCHFQIFSPGGIKQGSFQHNSVGEISTFIDLYIITVARAGSLEVWDRIGVKRFSTNLGYLSPRLAEGKTGTLFAFDFDSFSDRKAKRWDFTKLHGKDINPEDRPATEAGRWFLFAPRMTASNSSKTNNNHAKRAISVMLEQWLHS
ncbi:hypothetical protein IFR05_017450 [Cadophora sp. M221]|nr:hypothetical protein IFR05_017450 [Cadophora sp. M221]